MLVIFVGVVLEFSIRIFIVYISSAENAYTLLITDELYIQALYAIFYIILFYTQTTSNKLVIKIYNFRDLK